MRGLGAPPDAAAWLSLLGAAVVLGLMVWPPRWQDFIHRRHILPTFAVAAGVLSAAYVAYYLRGGPRIIDATSYWLEAQALAHGNIGLDVPGPTGSFRGRFLLSPPGSDRLTVLFPPGYPLVLALGVVLRVPMLVGPVLAMLLVWATFVLGERLWGRRDAACAAALFSVLSAALRYHTADTMSHGLAALLLAMVVLSVSNPSRAALVGAGLACGLLVATRPVTGGVGLAILATSLWRRRSVGSAAVVAASLLPGAALLVWHQHAATGSLWGSSHLRYYALADGPPGCFRYGFGSGIGCLHEHGDFVRKFLPQGHGLLQGLAATARRLRLHLIDVANLELLALALPLAAWRVRRSQLGQAVILAILAVIVGYAPFYFDGNYPGGGARLFADVLPLEHALLGGLAVRLRVLAPALAASLVGFACHASFEHRALSRRDGGRPMFDARVLRPLAKASSVVFVDTDHGFDLGYRPWRPGTPLVARFAGDAHDADLVQALGGVPAYRYSFDPRSGKERLRPYFPPLDAPFEAEADWPPLEVSGGWVEPKFLSAACAPSGKGLALHPLGGTRLVVTLELYATHGGRYRIETRWVSGAPHSAGSGVKCSLADGHWRIAPGHGECFSDRGPPMMLLSGRNRVVLEVEEDGWILDAYRALPAP